MEKVCLSISGNSIEIWSLFRQYHKQKIDLNEKVYAYTEYRVLTGLKYLILYDYNAYPKSDHEIASVDAIVYERAKK